ncbi:MAG: Crp/Fnr family transcriptional regulator [Pseudomonadota bacterium]
MSTSRIESDDDIIRIGTSHIGGLFRRRGVSVALRTDAVLFLDGDPADGLYEVRRGVVRCFTVAEDGRKHIFSFACQGALIGLGTSGIWHSTAEAVSDVTLRHLPRSVFTAAMQNNPVLAEWRSRMVDAMIRRRELQLLTMASRTAEARLLVFLQEFAEIAGPDLKRGGDATALPMSRRDIADHLGISFETVSRAFSALKRRGTIELIGPGVFRLRRATAEALSGGSIFRLPRFENQGVAYSLP